MPPAGQMTPDNNGGYNVFAAKACQCLRALGSVMVMIVLGLIALTYYTTVFLVYGKLMFKGGDKATVATFVVVVYNLLARRRPLRVRCCDASDLRQRTRAAAGAR